MANMIQAMGQTMEHISQTGMRVEVATAASAAASETREAALLAKQNAPAEEEWMKFVSTKAGPW